MMIIKLLVVTFVFFILITSIKSYEYVKRDNLYSKQKFFSFNNPRLLLILIFIIYTVLMLYIIKA